MSWGAPEPAVVGILRSEPVLEPGLPKLFESIGSIQLAESEKVDGYHRVIHVGQAPPIRTFVADGARRRPAGHPNGSGAERLLATQFFTRKDVPDDQVRPTGCGDETAIVRLRGHGIGGGGLKRRVRNRGVGCNARWERLGGTWRHRLLR